MTDHPEGEHTETRNEGSPDDASGTSIDDAISRTDAGDGEPADPVPGDDAPRPLALDNPEANELASQRRPTVLVLAGGVESGKTSIYAAIYERLNRGPFAGRLFAGSLTI